MFESQLLGETDYVLADHQAYRKYMLAHARRGLRGVRIIFAASACSIPLAMLAHWLGLLGLGNPEVFESVAYVLAAVLVISMIVLQKLLSRLLQPSPGGPLLAARRYRLDDDGVRVSSESFEHFFRWPILQNWTRTRDYYFLRIDASYALQIPRRAFGGEAEQQAVEALIERRTGRKPEV